MSNAPKLLLGVLAISGFIAIILPAPSSSDLPTDSSASEVASAVPLPSPVIGNEPGITVDDAETEAELPEPEQFKFGEPSIDGQPFGGSYEPPRAAANANLSPDGEGEPEAPLPTDGEGNVIPQ